MKTPFLILALLTLVYSAYARLGETPDEITARYGAGIVITATNDDIFIENFDHNGFKIAVTFWKGKSAQEALTKMVAGDPAMIFQQDGDKLFQEVSGGGKIATERAGHSSVYTNKANGAKGMLSDSSLRAQTKEYVSYCEKKYAEKNKGF